MLSLASSLNRKIVCLPIQRCRLLLQEEVEIVIGEFVPHEALDFARMLDLPLAVVQFPQRNMSAAVGGQFLTFELLDLDGDGIDLLLPVLKAAIPGRLR